MANLRLLAPAKINLFLEILGKRSDGYHEIETVMQTVNLYDRLEIKETIQNGIKVISDHCSLPQNKTNLVYQAAALIKQYCVIKQGVRVFINKRIPIGAGLGGGSSDAATTLIGLNRLWHLGLAHNELTVLAARLGSDVPFFINGGTALCQGRGEIVFPIACKQKYHYLIILPEQSASSARYGQDKPPLVISTSVIYQNIKKRYLTKKPQNINIFISTLLRGSVKQLGHRLFNRLEQVVFRKYPQMRSLYKVLKQIGFAGVMVSGSGSSILGLGVTSGQIDRGVKKIRRNKLGRVFEVHSLN